MLHCSRSVRAWSTTERLAGILRSTYPLPFSLALTPPFRLQALQPSLPCTLLFSNTRGLGSNHWTCKQKAINSPYADSHFHLHVPNNLSGHSTFQQFTTWATNSVVAEQQPYRTQPCTSLQPSCFLSHHFSLLTSFCLRPRSHQADQTQPEARTL